VASGRSNQKCGQGQKRSKSKNCAPPCGGLTGITGPKGMESHPEGMARARVCWNGCKNGGYDGTMQRPSRAEFTRVDSI